MPPDTNPIDAPRRTRNPDAGRYAFPASPRQLRGAMSVKEACDRLLEAFGLHRGIVRAIAGRLIGIPEYELKIELAHHLYHHAEASRALRTRLQELRVPAARMDAAFADRPAALIEAVQTARSSRAFVAGLSTLARYATAHHQSYLDCADGLVDLPSIRVVARIQQDLIAMEHWNEQVLAAFAEVDGRDRALEAWCGTLWDRATGASGRAVGLIDPGCDGALPVSSPTYARSIACARDERFEVFHHTRQYTDGLRAPDGAALSEYEKWRLDVLRTQRDELDAIETFANVLFDLDPLPFDLMMALARFIWDEARHSEMGQRALGALGYDPFDIPCGIIGINVRSPLPPLVAFAQINTFGELNQVGGLRALAQEAGARGDLATSRAIDFVHADEMLHLRQGRMWLRELLKDSGISLEEFEETARQQAVRRLQALGVFGEDYGLDTSARELAKMLGE